MKTKMSSYCFQDCLSEHKYSGIRTKNSVGHTCYNYKDIQYNAFNHNWCIQLNNEKPFCYHKKDSSGECDVPKCPKYSTGMFCPDVKYELKYTSVRLSWTNPDTKFRDIKSYIILLYEIGERQTCIQAIVMDSQYNFELHKYVSDLYSGCTIITKVKKVSPAYVLNDLKLHNTYRIYVAGIMSATQTSFINKKTQFKVENDPAELSDCFEDCFDPNFSYAGLRTTTKGGRTCRTWKSIFNGTKANRVSNRCFVEGNVPMCYTDENTTEECHIPLCKDLRDNENFCLKVVKTHLEEKLIAGKWDKPNSNSRPTGYVVLRHNERQECEESLIYGGTNASLFSMQVQNLYLPCYQKHYISKVSFQFKFDKRHKPETNFVYIFAILNLNKISKIRRLAYTRTISSNCFNDCYDNKKYKGIRTGTENNKTCSFNDIFGWCQNLYAEKPWCLSEDSELTRCRVPKCADTKKGVYCVDTEVIHKKPDSFKLMWITPTIYTGHKINGYIVLLYEVGEKAICKRALIYGYKIENLKEQVIDLFKSCSNQISQENVDTHTEFKDLTPYMNYDVYVTGIIDHSHVGYIKKLNVDGNCLNDCLMNNEYNGLRTSTVKGKKCVLWRLHFNNKAYQTRIANKCYKFRNKYECRTEDNKTEECFIPVCDKQPITPDSCVKVKEIKSTDQSISGKWIKNKYVKYIGYVLLVHDEKEECLYSIVYGDLKPNEYDLHVQSFYMTCETVKYVKNVTYEYTFDNVLSMQTYTLYLFGTLGRNQTSVIRRIPHTTNLMRNFKDCQSYHYTGIRSSTAMGVNCQPWIYFFTVPSYTKKPSNWCSKHKNKVVCSVAFEHLEECNIPECKDLILPGSNDHVVLARSDFNGDSITGEWMPNSLRDVAIGYVVTLHNQFGECIESIVQGPIKPDDYDIKVRNFFISCWNKPLHSPQITYLYEFRNLEPDKNYDVYMLGTLSSDSTSKVTHVTRDTKAFTTGNIKNCFAHCKTPNGIISSLVYYVGSIPSCEKIVMYRSCAQVHYLITKRFDVQGFYSLNSSVVKIKGFILLLYGSKVCHKAIIHGPFKVTNRNIEGFYKNCTTVEHKKEIEYKFKLTCPLNKDNYVLYIVPIVNNESHGYVTQVKLVIKPIPTNVYMFITLRSFLFITLFVVGLCQLRESEEPN